MKQADSKLELVTPDYEGGGILGLVSSILSAFGVEPRNAPCREEILPMRLLSDSPAIVFLVCDALGYRQLEDVLQKGSAPNLAHLVRESEGGLKRLTSVFPATTSTALATMANTVRRLA